MKTKFLDTWIQEQAASSPIAIWVEACLRKDEAFFESITAKELLILLNAPNPHIHQFLLEQLLPKKLSTTFTPKENSSIFVAGLPLGGVSHWGFMLRPLGISLKKEHAPNIPYILLGAFPGKHLSYLLEHTQPTQWITEKQLRQYIQQHKDQLPFYLLQDPQTEKDASFNLDALLLSDDPQNVLLALQLIETGGISEQYLCKLLALAASGKHEYKVRAKIGLALRRHFPASRVRAALNFTQYFGDRTRNNQFADILEMTGIDPHLFIEFSMKCGNIEASHYGLKHSTNPKTRQIIFDFYRNKEGTARLSSKWHRYLQKEDWIFFKAESAIEITDVFHHFPDYLKHLPHIQSLKLSGNNIPLTEELKDLKNLHTLKIQNSSSFYTPVNIIFQLKQLKHFELTFNGFYPQNDIDKWDKFDLLPNLEQLSLINCSFNKIPDSIYKLKKLTHLDLSKNWIRHLQDEIGNLTNLKYLNLNFNDFMELPEGLKKLTQLREARFIAGWNSHSRSLSLNQIKPYFPPNCTIVI